MILAIDFDRTIHETEGPRKEGAKMGPPIVGAREALKALKAAGHTIIIHSCRGDDRGVIRDWMAYYGLPYDDVTNVKPAADVYLDDKGMKFVTWAQALDDLKELAKHVTTAPTAPHTEQTRLPNPTRVSQGPKGPVRY